jgi:GTP-binding protein HflX
VDDQLFTTLSTTTRTMARERKGVLLTDTVGFVSDVPLWLVEAFQSTFEEAFSSDLLLLLFDTSDPPVDLRRKVRLARDMLPSALRPDRVLPVLAKVDLASPTIVESALTFLRDSGFDRDPLLLSTQTGIGLAELREAILREFQYPIEILIRVRNDGETGAFFHWLHEHTDVLTKYAEVVTTTTAT